MIKALLFDFDGTLLNTNELIIQTFMHVLNERFPGQYSPQDCIKFIGPSLIETFEQITPNEVDEMVEKYREWNQAHHDELVTEYDGVIPFTIFLNHFVYFIWRNLFECLY